MAAGLSHGAGVKIPLPQKVDVAAALDTFTAHWTPHVLADLNGQQVKVAKLLGRFEWHSHAAEDELFWVLSGSLEMHFRDGMVTLEAGQMLVVPRGVEHMPVAHEEVQVVLFEPAGAVNTGENPDGPLTVRELKRLS